MGGSCLVGSRLEVPSHSLSPCPSPTLSLSLSQINESFFFFFKPGWRIRQASVASLFLRVDSCLASQALVFGVVQSMPGGGVGLLQLGPRA